MWMDDARQRRRVAGKRQVENKKAIYVCTSMCVCLSVCVCVCVRKKRAASEKYVNLRGIEKSRQYIILLHKTIARKNAASKHVQYVFFFTF